MKAFVEKAIRNYNVGLIALQSIEAPDLYVSGSAVSEPATRWHPGALYNTSTSECPRKQTLHLHTTSTHQVGNKGKRERDSGKQILRKYLLNISIIPEPLRYI